MFWIPALVGIDPFDALDATLYPTPEEAMAAWESSAPVELRKGTLMAVGLTPEMLAQVNGEGLWRDPNPPQLEAEMMEVERDGE